MSTFAEILDHPISPGIAAHIWQAHEEQVERAKRTQISHEMRGKLRWNVNVLGWEFQPGEGADTQIMDLIHSGNLGAEVKLTFNF
jgi:hypothetical protein